MNYLYNDDIYDEIDSNNNEIARILDQLTLHIILYELFTNRLLIFKFAILIINVEQLFSIDVPLNDILIFELLETEATDDADSGRWLCELIAP